LAILLGDRSSARAHALTLHDELSSFEDAANAVKMVAEEVVNSTVATFKNNIFKFWLA
jgi:hypothetical protein